jgi:NAD(P)-dependent dehydrogenase (short-subunit alcohol dehydrogenase family)
VRLEGKVALITGADGPIGGATALRFAREGALVVLNDLISKHLERIAREIEDVEHGRALIALGEPTLPVHVERAVREAVDTFGSVDILVNNAGDHEDSALRAASLWTTAVLPLMRKRGWGRVINTSTVVGLGHVGKARGVRPDAVIDLTKRLALEHARDGVTVNCVAPGATMTAMPEEAHDAMAALIPMGRVAEPREIAAVHVFLASDDAAYVTGQVIYVDGGLSAVE